MITKIIPAAVVTEYIPNETHIGIESMSVTYIQPADTNSDRDDIQTITIEAFDSACVTTQNYLENEKSGMYLNIKTDKWSVDNPDTLKFLLEDFLSRLNKISTL